MKEKAYRQTAMLAQKGGTSVGTLTKSVAGAGGALRDEAGEWGGRQQAGKGGEGWGGAAGRDGD